jgi:iron complex transport system substrate-binding protein
VSRTVAPALALWALAAALPLPGAAPLRIVSTAPSLTEILYVLGLGERVAGVTEYCRYPDEARSKPKVGSFLQPDYERILALRPDLVLVIKNPAQVTQKLRQLGLRAEEFDQDSMGATLRSMERIAALAGVPERGVKLAAELRKTLDGVAGRVAGRRRVSALFLVGRSPGMLQGMVGAGPGTFIDELMTLAGGRNMLAGSPIQYPKVSVEQILSSDPDYILDMGDFAHASGRPGQPEAEIQKLWAAYPRLAAVANRRVRVIASEVFIRPGPRRGEAASEFLRLLHPEVTSR